LLAHATWLVAIFFKAVQAGRGRSPVLVARNGLPPMRKGLKRKSRKPAWRAEELERKARFFFGCAEKKCAQIPNYIFL
jgi:hypothetical protein